MGSRAGLSGSTCEKEVAVPASPSVRNNPSALPTRHPPVTDYAQVAQLAAPIAFRRAGRMSLGRAQLLNLLEMALEPLVLVLSLWGVALLIEGRLRAPHMILALIVFSLTFPSEAGLSQPAWRAIRNVLTAWLALSGLLFLFGYASRFLEYFHDDTLITWWWVAPLCQVAALLLLRWSAPAIRELEGGRKRAVLAGMNEPGIELARRLNADRYSSIRVVGFVDDRARERLTGIDDFAVLGSIQKLPEFVKKNRIELVYLRCRWFRSHASCLFWTHCATPPPRSISSPTCSSPT